MPSGSDDGRASADNAPPGSPSQNSIVKITLDEDSFLRRRPEVEHEREVALFDLLERNHFELIGEDTDPGPYHVSLILKEDRLVFILSSPAGIPIREIALPTRPFRSVIKDYFLICESYFDAIKTLSPAQIESIDMGRRSLHNEGALKLEDRLSENVKIDNATARRLFTLLCVLHMRG